MSRNRFAIQPLDSLQLAKYSIQVRCIVCSGDNMFDADRCRHCGAPMTISTRAAESKRDLPHFVAALGGINAGKTTYLAMMVDMLSRRANDPQLIARGAFSVGRLRDLVHQLRHCQFPEPTDVKPEHWNWLHGTLDRANKPSIDIVIPDFSGQACCAEMESPQTDVVIRAFLRQCRGAFVFVDAARLASGDTGPDYEAMRNVSYLSELPKNSKKKKKQDVYEPPVAIVFTKTDQLETDQPQTTFSAAEFAREKASGLFRHCKERLTTYEFFFTSVTSATVMEGDTAIPLRIEPRGIEAPPAWLSQQL